jgi:peptidoglycan/xylan/chitin deacetylase (PgdA/CDA1 family)
MKPTRRQFLASSLTTGVALGTSTTPERDDRALVAITLDLEMSREYPTRDQTHWDYEKGNLDADTKRYALEAARRVRARGGRIHFFVLGRTLEQEDVGWLEELIREGHPIGSHTYDHVNVKATTPEQIQFRFKRSPWLIEGKAPAEVIAENVRLTTRAMKLRLGIDPAGFRTPGGFSDGLKDRPDVQAMLLKQGFTWVSSLYPAHLLGPAGQAPSREVFDAIVQAQEKARPFAYPSGLIEVPMNPISDVSALRAGRWPLAAFLEAIRRGLTWVLEHGATYDFLAHPSCLVVADPEFRALDLICDLVLEQRNRARFASLGELATRAR